MRSLRIGLSFCVLLVVLIAFGACRDTTTDPVEQAAQEDWKPERPRAPRPPRTIAGLPATDLILDQGWPDDIVQRYWFTGQGSEMIPAAWIRALKRPNGQRFATAETFARYGYLPASPTKFNPEGLPVGFAISKNSATQGEWFGYTCSGCHEGQVEYGGKRMVIVGGATLANLTGLLGDLIDTMLATGKDPAALAAFASEVLGPNHNAIARDQLRTSMIAQADALNVRKLGMVASGYGRLDAFGTIFNEVLAFELDLPNNQRFADAPVSYPFIWDSSHTDRVQWNGSISNAGPGPIGRNIAEITGVFGNVIIDRTRFGYSSSAKVTNLGDLEMWLRGLWSPLWPDEVLPKIDRAKAQRGKTHYDAQCLSCHAMIDRMNPYRKVIAKMEPIAQAGTDPRMATNFAQRFANTGRLQGGKEYYAAGKTLGAEEQALTVINNVVIGMLMAHPDKSFRAMVKDWEGLYLLDGKYDPVKNPSYKARPLNGIWATAPYLHNGSVANLWELLQPVGKRSRSFWVGSHAFDPVRVGFSMTPGPNTSLFTAEGPGNSNAGHTWGTNLTDQQKWELIEYLKSL